MISVKSVSIQNFRQFKSVEVNFPYQDGIYILSGVNGIGKSNFMNAICWCLYGEMPFLSQGEGNTRKNIINESALSENDDEASVSIKLDVDSDSYLIRRYIKKNWLQESNKQNGELKVFKITNGNHEDQPEPDRIINNEALHESLRHLFIFDGESISNLFAKGYNKKLEKNIKKVANVDILESAIRHVGQTARALEKERDAHKEDAENKQEKEEELDNNVSKLEKITQEIKSIEEKKEDLERKENNILEKVKQFEAEKELQAEKTNTEDLIKEVDEDIQKLKNKLSDIYTSSFPFATTQDYIDRYVRAINEEVQQGNVPPPITPQILDNILTSEKCICGSSLGESGSHAIKTLKVESTKKDELSFLKDHTTDCKDKVQELAQKKHEFISTEEELVDKQNRRENLERRLKNTEQKINDAQISSSGRNPEQSYNEIRDQHKNAISDLAIKKDRKKDIEEQNVRLNKEINSLAIKSEYNELVRNKILKAERAKRMIEEILDKIIDSTKDKVAKGTIDTFTKLHWKKDYKNVGIDDKYFINLELQDGTSRNLDDLSTGEKKMLGLSLINALSQKLPHFEFPFFIDGPIEQLDDEVVSETLESLQNLAENKQVIILSVNHSELEPFLTKVSPDRKFEFYREDPANDVTSIRSNA